MRSQFFNTMLVLSLAILSCGLGADLEDRNATQWFPYLEWAFENTSWQGSPFDVKARATFVHTDSGTKCTTELFYERGTRWKLRFTGSRTGQWTFSISSPDPDLDGHTGTLMIRPNPQQDAHGYLRGVGSQWGWQGTEDAFVPQLVMWDYLVPDSSPGFFHDRPRLIDAKIDAFLDGHGFTGFHVSVIGGRWFDMEAKNDSVNETMIEPDPRTFEALELMINRTHAAGGMVHLWMWGDHQRRQTCRSLKGGMGGPVDRRLQRYIAARLGPVPGWSMGYGFDLDEWVTASQVRQWRDRMHHCLGWPHFLGGRPVGPNRGLDHTQDAQWNQGLDYASYEHHQPTYDTYVAALRALPGQPVLSEDRFRIREGKYPEKDYSLERTRRGLYHSTLAGGVGNIWGIHPDQGPGGVYPNQAEIKTYATFFFDKGRFLPDMVRANHLSPDEESAVLSSPGTQSLVFYQEDTNSFQLDLSDWVGNGPAIAVNTRRAYREIDLGELPARTQTLTLPTTSDWIIALGRFRVNNP
ncbi:MAG: DUF5060 domain-containing protein [Planctomycetes bacterium]|nr:DUF5060 domain-containing protein [Planctomycetota bacterium]